MAINMFGVIALGAAALAAVILFWYLVARPPLTRATKIALLFGIGVFPILTAGSGNYAGFEATKAREFCGSCHVMTPYLQDVTNPASHSLSAVHTRNEAFGHESCYTCHAEYGMFGTIATKAAGMGHVYHYLLTYRNMSLAQARTDIHIKRPFPSATCRRCHSTTAPSWRALPDHRGLAAGLAKGEVDCMGGGCHGPAHPWSKVGRPGYDSEGKPVRGPAVGEGAGQGAGPGVGAAVRAGADLVVPNAAPAPNVAPAPQVPKAPNVAPAPKPSRSRTKGTEVGQ